MENLQHRKNQQGKGLKILTRRKGLKILTQNQMLKRLPILLAQLNAGNNSEKLKNEIGQLLYLFYKNLQRTL